MSKEEDNQCPNVIEQFMKSMGYTQRGLARAWNCSPDKVWRAVTKGKEPSFTAEEIVSIDLWLEEHFGKRWSDLPKSMLSSDVLDFLEDYNNKKSGD
ncbi:hypothetical protein [Leptothoe spongobia]|uniref:Uncharacterized protein n=1 Tax=Leptothoe spongobia TAU-MAC 1115 TaxID=1967444 RepID=A0A947DC13_9CYAN|nr:hypothetical protein [Leptothoe spongobia]MBT9314400.1 hypothetical protein [Leptothoe spongobia TAU-MAC 1115]